MSSSLGMPRLKEHHKIIIALISAAIVGGVLRQLEGLGPNLILQGAELMGAAFLRGLKMVIVPLIFFAVSASVASLGTGKGLGRLGFRVIAYYFVTTLFAVAIGVGIANVVRPGISGGDPVGSSLGIGELDATLVQHIGNAENYGAMQVLERLVPDNLVRAAAEGEMLGLILFAILFGLATTGLPESLKKSILELLAGGECIMTRITGWIMRLAPIGVFGLVTKVIYQTGSEAIRPLLIFSVTVVAALLIHVAIVLPLLMRFSGASAWKHYKNMAPALLTAFSTSSSTATLPVSVECVIEGSGVSRRVASFSLPLGATMNMDGTALYECVAALFIAQAYGLDLSFGQQALILILALLTSIGVAGIPSASLVAIALILGAIGLPLEAAGVILAVDRILDMLRTSVNVLGDSTCAVVVARFEGEVTNVALEPA